LISNSGNDDSPLQLPSDHHNLSSDRSAHDAEERKNNVKRRFGQQDATKERLGIM